jgi:ubiquinone/menaquinone biosynthesis C-methylase UbiE
MMLTVTIGVFLMGLLGNNAWTSSNALAPTQSCSLPSARSLTHRYATTASGVQAVVEQTESTLTIETMDRIQADLTDEGYKYANEAFQKYWSGDHDEYLKFIRSHTPSRESDIKVLSVGAGDGMRDEQALKVFRDVCPSAEIHFTAVEPNSAQLNALKKVFQKNTGIVSSLEAIESTGEDYEFPESTFDIIMFTHSLYHMAGAQSELLDRSIKALKPNGRIFVALSSEQGGIHQMMGSFWGTIDYSRFEKGDGLFGQESLLKILSENYKDRFEFKALPGVYIDMRNSLNGNLDKGGRHLLNFVLQSDTSKLPSEIESKVIATLDGMAPKADDGSRRLPHGSGVFAIHKK